MTGSLDNSLEFILLAGKFHAKPQRIGNIGLADILGIGRFPLSFDIHRPGNTHADIPCLADGEQFSHFKLQEQRPRKFVVHQRSVVIIVVMQADASRDFDIRIIQRGVRTVQREERPLDTETDIRYIRIYAFANGINFIALIGTFTRLASNI